MPPEIQTLQQNVVFCEKGTWYHQGKKVTPPHTPSLIISWCGNAMCFQRWGAAKCGWQAGGEGCGGAKPGAAARPLGAARREGPHPAQPRQGDWHRKQQTLPLPALTLSGWARQSTAIICFKEGIFGTQCTICFCCPRDSSIISSFASSVIVPVSKQQTERIYSSGVG